MKSVAPETISAPAPTSGPAVTFDASRSSTDDPKRDWYVWRDPAPDGGPPNNWVAAFRPEPAWTYDEATGQWVTLSNEEIANCTMPKGVAEILAFVPLDKLHKAYLTTGLAQVRAKTSGMKAAQSSVANKSFALFLAGMKQRKVAALIKVSMRGPARFAAITPDGDMLYLQPSDGIRQAKAMDMGMVNPTELDLVGQLIDTIGKGTPELVDDTAAKVREYVAVRAQGMEIGYPVSEPSVDIDLFASLSASISAAKTGKAGAA